MGVDSVLEMYSMLWAWQQYGAIWDVMKDTGLAFLPFFGLLFNHFVDTSTSQNPADAAATSLRSIELDLILMFSVIVLAVQPIVPLQLKEMEYVPICGDQIIQAEKQGKEFTSEDGKPIKIGDKHNPKTGYDYMQMSKLFNEVRVPAWWYGVLAFSHGFVHAAKTTVGCIEDITLFRYNINTKLIDDADLVKQLIWFGHECYLPALSKYHEYMLTHKSFAIPSAAGSNWLPRINLHIGNDEDQYAVPWIKSNAKTYVTKEEFEAWFGTQDTQWMGSQILTWLFYHQMHPRSYADPERVSTKTCFELWQGYLDENNQEVDGLVRVLFQKYAAKVLPGIGFQFTQAFLRVTTFGSYGSMPIDMVSDVVRPRVNDYIAKKKAEGNYKKGTYDNQFFEFTNPVIGTIFRDEVVRKLVGNTVAFTSTAEEGEWGFGKAYSEGMAKLGKKLQALKTGPELQITRDVIPIVGALTLLAIIILLPFGLVFSSYSLEFVLIGAMALFTIKFWFYLWHIAWWLEQNLWKALHPSMIWGWGDIAGKEDIVWLVTASLYTVLPILFAAVMGWAGVRVSGMVSSAVEGMTKSAREGAGSVGTWAPGAAMRAGSRFASRLLATNRQLQQQQQTIKDITKENQDLKQQNRYLRTKLGSGGSSGSSSGSSGSSSGGTP